MRYLALLLFLTFPTMLFSQEGIILEKIEFFERGYEAPKEEIIYATDFSKENTRYIWTRVFVQNLFYKKTDQSHLVLFRYYNPFDSLIAEFTATLNIKREQEKAYTSRGWGWEEPGRWKNGIYRVEVYIDEIFMGEKQFIIIEQKYLQTTEKTIELIKIKFWESPESGLETNKRVYTNKFLKSKTRYINTTLEIKNLQYGISDNTVNLYLKYYLPDGTLWETPKISVVIEQDWEYAEIYNGCGFSEPGLFEPGTYRVEAYYCGEIFAVGYFTITTQ